MTIIRVMSETHSLADTKARLSEMVDLVAREQERVYITRRGRPVAVLVSVDELEGLEETLEILAEPDAAEEIRKARADIEAGRYHTAEQLREALRRRKE
jgi:prevent-host-death family protein